MRRLLFLLSLVAVAGLALVATVSARTETRFTVLDIRTSGKPIGSRLFIYRGKLVEPGDHRAVVGHDRLKFKTLPGHRLRFRGVFSFPGQGSLKALGVFGPNRNNDRIPIIGGTGEFNGAAGKLKRLKGSPSRTLWRFIFVQ